MVRMRKRGLALLLALCTVLGLLAGCGKNNDAQQLSATVYVPKYVDLGVDLDDIMGSCTDGEYIYLVGETQVRTERKVSPYDYDTGTDEVYYDYSYIYDLYRVPLEGGTAEKLPNYTSPAVPEGYEGSAYIEDIQAVGDGTLWVTENVYVWGRREDSEKYPDGIITEPTPRAAAETAAVAVPDIAVDVDYDYDYDDYEYEDFSSMNTTVRRHVSADGTELGVLDIANLEEKLGVDWVNYTNYGDDGTVYVTTDETLYVLDSQLNTRFTLELPPDTWSPVTPLNGGQACINTWYYEEATEVYGYKVTMIDMEKQEWGTEYLLPSSAYNIYPGGGDYLFYYQVNDAIYGWRKDAPEGTETGERLFSWIEADINSSNVQGFFFLPDGRVAAMMREWIYDDEESRLDVSVAVLTATPRDQLPEKTTLTYATMYLSYEDRGRIIEFNKTSEKYRIEVKDYAEFNTGSDSSAGLQKLNTEIIAGVVPDILCTDSLPLKQYAARGVLEDLWPFIDNDPDLGRDKLMVKPLEADQVNGKLYEIFSGFIIRTVAGPKNIVGDSMSWTLADLKAALAKMPEGCAIFGEDDTKDGMLSTVLTVNMENFVDWETGKCYFDTDNFKSLLEFCNSFVAEYDYENVDWSEWEDSTTRILTGKQMLSSMYISRIGAIQRYNALFQDGLTYVGFPVEDGSVGSSFSPTTGYAISTTCKDKEGAWSYLRQILLPDTDSNSRRYYYYGLPVNKELFDQAVEEAMTPQYYLDENGDPYLDENGEPLISNLDYIWLNDGTEIPCHLMTDEEYAQLMDLYNSITSMARYDENISEIVNDVAGSYFAGDKSLDETASLIQNRVNLYVNESK